jgi:translation elongation factor P/translation initiation factor 5A
MINSQDIKNGTCIRLEGKLYFCIEFLHVKPGKGNTIMRTKLKDVVTGRVLERRFNIGEKLEDVRVERRPHQYLYMEGADYIFMNQETFDQIPIAHDLINGVDFLLEGMVVDVVSDAFVFYPGRQCTDVWMLLFFRKKGWKTVLDIYAALYDIQYLEFSVLFFTAAGGSRICNAFDGSHRIFYV